MATQFDPVPATTAARPFLNARSDASPCLASPNRSAEAGPQPQSIKPTVHTDETFDGNAVHGELLTFDKRDAAELEFSLQSHVVILLRDGISGSCEWSNGGQTGKQSSVAPNTIIFNPARDYLCIRKGTSQQHCRMWLLSIGPALVNRLDVGEVNLTNLQFRQQIGIEDEVVRQTLLAVKQELEAPGLNSRLYIDTLLMLLLTRLMRFASNLATPQRPAYVKGGLPNWRLKRALEILEADITKTPPTAELAGPLQLHPTFFCRKNSTGLTPHRYLLARVPLATKVHCSKRGTFSLAPLGAGSICSLAPVLAGKKRTAETVQQSHSAIWCTLTLASTRGLRRANGNVAFADRSS
jgi:hypothetical protein